MEAQTVSPINDGVLPGIFGGNLLNRFGSGSRRSVLIRRRIIRPNGAVYLELEDPAGIYTGTRVGYRPRFWPFALENGNSSRGKLIEPLKENKYTFDDESNKDDTSKSDTHRRMIFVRPG